MGYKETFNRALEYAQYVQALAAGDPYAAAFKPGAVPMLNWRADATASANSKSSGGTGRGSGRKRGVGAVVKRDGTSSGSSKMRRKKRKTKTKKKKSLKKQIQAVKRLIPKMSTKLFRTFTTMCLNNEGFNRNVIHEIKCFNRGDLETYVSNLTKVDSSGAQDYTTENTNIKMDLFFKLMLKNNITGNAKISYVFVECAQDTAESPLDDLLEELGDRGYTGLPTKTSSVPALGTGDPSQITSFRPAKIVFGNGIHHVPMFSGTAVRRNWKFLGPVRTATIGPGDTLDLVWSKKGISYKPEIYDQDSFLHMKGYDFRVLVALQGDLAHDGTNYQRICRSDCQLDGERQQQCLVKYANPKGLKEVVYSDTLDSTAISTPKHADNMDSAIEADSRT